MAKRDARESCTCEMRSGRRGEFSASLPGATPRFDPRSRPFRLTITRILDQAQKELFSSLNRTIRGNEKPEWQLLAIELYESNWGGGG